MAVGNLFLGSVCNSALGHLGVPLRVYRRPSALRTAVGDFPQARLPELRPGPLDMYFSARVLPLHMWCQFPHLRDVASRPAR